MSLALISPQRAAAVQTVTDPEKATVRVSNRDLNRFVAPDRLRKGISNKPIEVTVDGNEAFVNIPPAVEGPVELHLLTEKETYTLMLIPAPIPAETIVIRGRSASLPDPRQEALPYLQRIKALIRTAANNTAPPGYDVTVVPDGEEDCPVNECSLIAVRRYTGREFVITEYRLSNPTKESRVYTETLFSQKESRAVAIERHHLDPGEATRLFRVKEAP